MEVVKLGVDALDDIINLYLEQFKQEAWTKEQIMSSFNNASNAFFGIYDKKVLVCFACILTTIDDINLLDIATKEEYKNKGYAKAMLSFLLSLKEKEQTFSLEVKSKNLPAINLYQSFGFKTLHIRKNYYKDGDCALCMFLLND